MNKFSILLFLSILFFTSCATLNTKHPGVGRVKEYDFVHQDVPEAFNGFRIAFISDLHYKSLLTEKRLDKLVGTVSKLKPDIMLLGGDYHEGCEYVPSLFSALGSIETPYQTIAVLGNNDYENCYDDIAEEMKQNKICLLEHELDTITKGDSRIIIAGVRNPFDLAKNGVSPTLKLSPQDFVILLVHTPDYAEDVPITNTDLVLAGHTHGGQVTLFGLYAPVIPSRYGQRFKTGLKYNSAGIPIIITNGIGTSNKNIRMFAPSEIVIITLKRAASN